MQAAFDGWWKHNCLRLGAALAYYSVFSLGPLLILVTAICGFAYGEEAAHGQLFGQIRQLIGDDGAAALQSLLASAKSPANNVLASIIGFVTLLVGATGVFAELKDSLNLIWDVKPKEESGLWSFARTRLMSFAMILAIGFLLLVSLVVSAALAAVSKYVGEVLPVPVWVFSTLAFFVSLAMITVLFAMLFKVLPDTHVNWRDVWMGAGLTSLLFTIGKTVIGLYLGKSSVASAYGAAGSVVIVLLWTYYSSQILFFGAEFSAVYSRKLGSKKTEIRASSTIKPELA